MTIIELRILLSELRGIEDIEKLDADAKKHLFFLIDNVIQNFKTKTALAK